MGYNDQEFDKSHYTMIIDIVHVEKRGVKSAGNVTFVSDKEDITKMVLRDADQLELIESAIAALKLQAERLNRGKDKASG